MKVLYQHWPGDTEENQNIPQSGQFDSGPGTEPKTPKTRCKRDSATMFRIPYEFLISTTGLGL